ncbi:MAG: NERD domain-containing protein [Gammaproteobacteria bacterium]|nr:NERD domain-containing protein [Gammaproteobacteria bacterium]MBU1647292.1 NERD domain-containing protein [Gammaproteobacteria bacterium]MBU1972804.1 NERD domain-containing protein [Gammaproteobacteria bacterium]
MAFYLKRFFAKHSEILIFNGIRLEADGDAAQIDHLILHPYGFIVVESKSVQGKVQIKDDGQWIRWYGDNKSAGMASPITQARLQAEFLTDYIGRAANQEAFFSALPKTLLVAISDSGVILWPKNGSLSEVCKADQVADRIVARVAELASQFGHGNRLSATNLEKIAQFLLSRHKPLNGGATVLLAREPEPVAVVATPEPAVAPPPVEHIKVCGHCGSTSVEIRYAYSYHFHCRACGKNTPINESCAKCDGKLKIRRKGREHYLDCKACETSESYFLNPEEVGAGGTATAGAA